jgi:hypothetical protein
MNDSRDDNRTRQRPRSSYNDDIYRDHTMSSGTPLRCQFCSGQSFRRSTLRGADFLQIFLMRYPVRCLRCSQRQLVSFTVAGISVSSSVRPARPVHTSKNWSEPTPRNAVSAPTNQPHQH